MEIFVGESSEKRKDVCNLVLLLKYMELCGWRLNLDDTIWIKLQPISKFVLLTSYSHDPEICYAEAADRRWKYFFTEIYGIMKYGRWMQYRNKDKRRQMTHSFKYSPSVLSLQRTDDVSKLKMPLRHKSLNTSIRTTWGKKVVRRIFH